MCITLHLVTKDKVRIGIHQSTGYIRFCPWCIYNTHGRHRNTHVSEGALGRFQMEHTTTCYPLVLPRYSRYIVYRDFSESTDDTIYTLSILHVMIQVPISGRLSWGGCNAGCMVLCPLAQYYGFKFPLTPTVNQSINQLIEWVVWA